MDEVTATSFAHLEVNDRVIRMLAGIVPMTMKVKHVNDRYIYMHGGWIFERDTGFEHDPEIGSGSKFDIVASYLVNDEVPPNS